MAILDELYQALKGNKQKIAQSLIQVGTELDALEEWINKNIDVTRVYPRVGQELFEKDINILAKAYKLTIRLDRMLSLKWSDETAGDWCSVVEDMLVIKFDIALGEGFEFNQENTAYPKLLELSKMSEEQLLLYVEEAFDDINQKYRKYIIK